MRLKELIKKIFIFRRPSVTEPFIIREKPNAIQYDVREEEKEPLKKPRINSNYDSNLIYLKERFSYPLNNDIIFRELTLKGNRRAFLVFIDGMVSTEFVDLAIIKALQELPYISELENYKVEEYIIEKLISHSQAMATDDLEMIIEEINFGSCGVFVEGMKKGFSMDVREWGHRSIDKPENEQSIYGPQEAFAEMLRNNSALVRKIIKTEKLICEGVKIGKISKTRGVLMYIDDIANKELIDEVRHRIDGISMDYVISIEEVSMMMEEKTYMITNQILSTERPDRVARALTQGRVALLLNGSPKALVFPTTAFELTHSASDVYLRVPYSYMTRFIRFLAMFMSILLPALYLAITLFHQEMIPTYLLYAISASRENVPFPSVVELFLMDFSFEMIREAGIRMPGPIGSTLGIVGGLILGQAAVSAKIVSPIMIIIIAVTGIGSFATSDYSLSWSYRVLRILFILLASVGGFFGIAMGIFIYSVYLGAQKSFGVSFLSPLPEGGKGSISESLFTNPVWKKEYRPSYLVPKREKSEPKISRKWKIERKK